MRRFIEKLVPNRFKEEYRQARYKLNKEKEKIISSINDNERSNEDISNEGSEEKKPKKNRADKFFSLFSAGLAVTTVALGIVSLTGGLAAPFVFAALAIDVIAAAFEINRVARERRKEHKRDQEKSKAAKNKDEENSITTEKTMSDTISVSSDLSSENSIQEDRSYSFSMLEGLKGDVNKTSKRSTNKRSRRDPRNRKKILIALS